MIHDISPKKMHNQYIEKKPITDSCIVCIKEQNVLIKNSCEEIIYPIYTDFKNIEAEYTYLFQIDETDYFRVDTEQNIEINGFSYINVSALRGAIPKFNALAGLTAYHLNLWYNNNKFCGRCREKLKHSDKERMLFCSNCNNIIYPKISPVVIVAITDNDKLLMTKYAGRDYKRYALVAGFIEIGETAEEAVKREVMEEVGVEIKNITYYKSQPWGFSESLIMGYFAELDGDSKITLDENELSEGKWISREEIEVENDDISITNEMICKFANII